MADYLFKHKALESPRVSAAAKAAMFKLYNELNSVLLSGRTPTQADIGTGTGQGEQNESSSYLSAEKKRLSPRLGRSRGRSRHCQDCKGKRD